MDILRFINSKDIRNHLKGINYQFNTLEAAWLIYQSTNYTLYEKLDAFEELMQCYGSLLHSTIGGLFFLLSIFYGLVHYYFKPSFFLKCLSNFLLISIHVTIWI